MDGIRLEFTLNSRETCDCKMQTAGTYYQFAKVHSVILCMIRCCHLWIDAICEAFARMKLLFFLQFITVPSSTSTSTCVDMYRLYRWE